MIVAWQNFRAQGGFTMVEIVAVMVITVTLAAWAMPKMDRAADIGTGATANRLVAALQYAQVLAQRQGVDTNVEISATEFKVTQGAVPGTAIDFPMGSENKYAVAIPSDVSIAFCTNVTYKPDGTLVPAAGLTCLVNNGETRFTVKVEPTGHAYLVT